MMKGSCYKTQDDVFKLHAFFNSLKQSILLQLRKATKMAKRITMVIKTVVN